MKVIFLDFDGVLNSEASFRYEMRRRKADPTVLEKEGPVRDTLCHISTNNFQVLLDMVPEDTKIVISSTWRVLHDMDYLKNKLSSYGIDSSRVIDVTPQTFNRPRGTEISMWLEDHPEVDGYVILDDNSDMTIHMDKFVQTDWLTGLLLGHVYEAARVLKHGKNDAAVMREKDEQDS